MTRPRSLKGRVLNGPIGTRLLTVVKPKDKQRRTVQYRTSFKGTLV